LAALFGFDKIDRLHGSVGLRGGICRRRRTCNDQNEEESFDFHSCSSEILPRSFPRRSVADTHTGQTVNLKSHRRFHFDQTALG
jgi:hypothetical protein